MNKRLENNIQEIRKGNILKVSTLNATIGNFEKQLHTFLVCEFCNDKCASMVDLERHKKLLHKQNKREAKRFKCKECSNPFLNFNDLRRHKIWKRREIYSKIAALRKQEHLQNKISQQKSNLMRDISKLISKEVSQQSKCNCKGSCQINHFFKRWMFKHSKEFIFKLTNIEASKHNDLLKNFKCD